MFVKELQEANYTAIVKALDRKLEEVSSENEKQRAELLCNRGWCHQKLAMNRKALKDFNQALKLGLNRPSLQLLRGQALRSLEKHEEAKKVWRTALEQCGMTEELGVVQSLLDHLENPNRVLAGTPSAPKEELTNGSEAKPIPVVNAGPSERVLKLLKDKDPDLAVGDAVEMINQGRLKEAEELLEELARNNKKNPAVYVARGTARALLRKLEGAIEDFTASIEILPMYAESWKRRSQARGALGQNEEALKDLEKAIELSPDVLSKAECIVEKGMIYHKMRDYRVAVEVLEKSLRMNSKNAQAMNLLGQCRISLGDISQGLEAYNKTIEISPTHKDVYYNKCQALKEVGRVKDAEEAYKQGRKVEKECGRERYLAINRVMASMYQCMGEHQQAISYLEEVLQSDDNRQKLDCLFLRAICYHALGFHQQACEDYANCMEFEKYLEKDEPIEKRQLLVLAFYQKEMCLYLRHRIDCPISEFCLDKDLGPLFKELWCKKMSPTRELIAQYAFQKPIEDIQPPPPAPSDQAERILQAAQDLGHLLQNAHQGFLPNCRQQLSAGCAAIELAQAVLEDLKARQSSGHLMVKTTGSSGGDIEKEVSHPFQWRDAMDILVKWRQLSEPNDQVIWVDLLTPEEFTSGFGSHTPMFSGQTKCVRYYMNFERAFKKQKEVLKSTRKAYNSKNEEVCIKASDEEIDKAENCSQMYTIIGEDSWVIVPISSLAKPSETMEGTRLTLVKVPDQRDGFEFSIRTPVTPPRWAQFELDLHLAWENFMIALQSNDKVLLAKCILTYAYYWYNFMPLARGTAACGYTVILALFWAAGMPITVSIPQDYQVDWEAILEPHPDIFIEALYKWMVPDVARPDAFKGQSRAGSVDCGAKFPSVKTLPKVKEVLDTMRKRLQALNGMRTKQI